jgi:hypothetical protein
MASNQKFIPPAEIMHRRPDLPYATMKTWARAGKIPRRPNPNHKGGYLWDFATVEKLFDSTSAGAPVDEFEEAGDTWIWTRKVPLRFGVSKTTVRTWINEGCPYLLTGSGRPRKLETRTRRFEGFNGTARVFVRVTDLDAITAAMKKPQADSEWLTYREARSQFGLGRSFLIYHAKRAHPALGRPIVREWRTRKSGVKTVQDRVFSRQDLKAISDYRKNGSGLGDAWISRPQILRIFGIGAEALSHWQNVGCIYLRGKKIAAQQAPRPGFRTATDVWYHLRDEIKKIAPKYRQKKGERAFMDERGTWYPLFEAEKKSGMTAGTLANYRKHPCKYLSGKKLETQEVYLPLRGNSHGSMARVYLGSDLALIASKGKAAPAPAPRKGRGRPQKAANHRLMEDYRRAHESTGISLKDFCLENKVPLKTMVRARNAAAKARSRNRV